MHVRDVPVDMPFRFNTDDPTIYISRGNGWYNTPAGKGGGPWHDTTANVKEVPGILHSHSFDGLDERELEACARKIVSMLKTTKYTLGDLALVRYEYTKRELNQPEFLKAAYLELRIVGAL